MLSLPPSGGAISLLPSQRHLVGSWHGRYIPRTPLKPYIPPQKAYILKVRASPGPVPGNVRFHLHSGTRTRDSVVCHSKIKCSTSALGQKQTWRREILMSALPPKVDIADCDSQRPRYLVVPFVDRTLGILLRGQKSGIFPASCADPGSTKFRVAASAKLSHHGAFPEPA